MADLILTLASLKSKCDSAGVGTTATSSYPSLCPQYSNIRGYVTNGSTTVNITGSYANNQLVPDGAVGINKVPTSSATVYRNVSVGSASSDGGDIPASGGSRRAVATVTYQYTTRTYYSDGSSSDGTWYNGSEQIYGGYVSGSDLGTTPTSRTPKGTSTASGTVAGATRTASAINIYQQANTAVSGYFWFTGGQVSNVSNAGGTSGVPSTNSYRWYSTYTSGSSGYTTISDTGNITWRYGKSSYDSWTGVSSWSQYSSGCQYTAGSNSGNTKTLGYAVIKGTYNGSDDYIVRQVQQDGGYVSGPSITGYELKIRTNSISSWIPNSGGTSSYVTLDYIRFYTYWSDGSSDYETLSTSDCTFVGYNTNSTTSTPSSGWSTDPSNGTITAGANSGENRTVGYAFMKYKYYYSGQWYEGSDWSTVNQYGGYVASTVVYRVVVDVPSSSVTSPALGFYSSTNSQIGNGHVRVTGDTTLEYDSWSGGNNATVSKIHISENQSYNSCKYIEIRGYNGGILLNKTLINKITPGWITLTNSFSTSTYTSGYRIYVYYYSS